MIGAQQLLMLSLCGNLVDGKEKNAPHLENYGTKY